MYLDRISAADPSTQLIARDGLAQRQWETVLATVDAADQRLAWPSRPIAGFGRWLASCWFRAQSAGAADRNRLLLTANQSDALWQRVIHESEAGKALISTRGVSSWARQARKSLCDYALSSDELSAKRWQDDTAAFLAWNRHFEKQLTENNWIDPESLLNELKQLPAEAIGHDVILLDPPPPTPASTELFERWRDAGFGFETLRPSDNAAEQDALTATDPQQELRLAADWAGNKLESGPGLRLAVVIPDIDARRDEIARAFTERTGTTPFIANGGSTLGDIGLFGAAVTLIELIGGIGQFESLSRWLRSPFFESADAHRDRHASAIEIAMRSDPRAQMPFADAWRERGLRATIRRRLSDTAHRLDQAVERIPRRATPTTWTAVWQDCLATVGWVGFDRGLAETEKNAWENAWARFSELTPIVGLITIEAAVDGFRQIVTSESIYEPMPLAGVHLMDRVSQIGPGFDAAWIAGCTEEALIESMGANPLLPWSVQASHAMPGANPDDELAAARTRIDWLLERVRQAVFSCPKRVRDQPQLPSALIGNWREAEAAGIAAAIGPAARIGQREWESVIDEAPPVAGDKIRGGARTLDLQAKSPLKAFCVSRLRAEPLETPIRGIDARLKGLLIHRTLELLLDPASAGDADDRIASAIADTFSELVLPGNACWDAQVNAERRRIEKLVKLFIELESARPPFRTVAVEQRVDVGIGERILRCRIDRIDRDAAAGLIVIDYKTGRSAGGQWFDQRLGDCQLPLYAQSADEIAAIATIRLAGNEIDYRGAGTDELSLPGRMTVFEPSEWARQIDRWREQLSELVAEFAGGDVRVATDAAEQIASHALEHVGGAFAPLTRVGD